MKKYIEIEADYNDGDYVTKRTEITDDQLEKLKPIIEAIKNCETSHNWETEELCDDCTPEELYLEKGILTEEQIKFFNKNFKPYSEYGIHSIDSIKLLIVQEEINLLH